MSRIFSFFFVLLMLMSPGRVAAEVEYVELQSRFTKLHETFTVKDNLAVERISEIEIKALTDEAAQRLKRKSFSHSTSIEKFKVLEAYTLKADGRRIEVPKNNFQVTVNKGNNGNQAIFSDRTSVTIVFPDLEKGDSIYMKVKKSETEPMFPGNFSISGYFWSQMAYDDVSVTFDLPESIAFKSQFRKMAKEQEIKNGRKIIRLHYRNSKPIKINREDFGVWDASQEAGYALSTFMNYQSIAKAYAARALPKAVPNKRVRSLAGKIIGNEKVKRKQARRIYDWVATNISYAGNCIGVGAVVPHDTDFILENRMGDCKDHATLLEALYSAAGIQSTQALINAGSSYRLPDVPTVSAVNHVINYIPEWDQFVDSTASAMPFDRIPQGISDKPVILIQNYVAGKRTPANQPGDDFQEIRSAMKIQSDGSVTGNIHLQLKGQPAIEARRGWRHATQQQEDEWLKRIFSSQNHIGSAAITKDDPTPLRSDYSYSVEFERPDFIRPKGTGAFYAAPLLNASLSLYTMVNYPREEIEGYKVRCSNGRSVERLSYELPDGMKILAKPDDLEIAENHIRFKATYMLDKNRLEVFREIIDETPGNTCSADLINRQRKTLMKITENLQSQVIYQH